ncbi:MAG: Crp/Fnr family transcriptional regulator [Anaerolineaceae bacterium]|nr:Crp/Fnr family transcriptional regulator [Anaerolineaceae bacterium]
MDTKWLTLLRDVAIFENIPENELIHMLDCFQPRVAQYWKHEVVAFGGDAVNGIGVVLEGKLAVIKDNPNGSPVMVTQLKSGEMFGEMAAFSGIEQWPATVIAQEDSQVMFLSVDKIIGICQKGCFSHRQLLMNLLKILANKALLLNRKIEYLSRKTLRSKLAAYLLEQARRRDTLQFELPLKRDDLARFMNVARPSLSRELINMRNEGLISFDRSQFTILDRERLGQQVD